jgi:lipase chaperone LimK
VTPRRRTGWIIALLSVACIGLIIRHGHPAKPSASFTSAARHSAATSMADVHDRSGDVAAREARVENPQRALQEGSMRGTVADGDITLGFAGRLKPDLALRRLFDYYLALIGETDLPGVRKLLHQDLLQRQLAQSVVEDVMHTFDRYVGYLQAATTLAEQPGLTLQNQLPQLDALRQQMLGKDLALEFYGAEQAQQEQLLRRLAVEADHSLSPAERARRLQALDAATPAPEQEARVQATVGDLVRQQTTLFDEAHADSATRHAERAQVWGDAVANRLGQLDRQRAQWQSRLDAYAAQSERIQNNAALSAASRQTALQQLLQTSFHGTEQLQVEAMAHSGLLGVAAR